VTIDPPGPGWWLASDGQWYPPELHPEATTPSDAAVATSPAASAAAEPSGAAAATDVHGGAGPIGAGGGGGPHPGWWRAANGHWYPPDLRISNPGALLPLARTLKDDRSTTRAAMTTSAFGRGRGNDFAGSTPARGSRRFSAKTVTQMVYRASQILQGKPPDGC